MNYPILQDLIIKAGFPDVRLEFIVPDPTVAPSGSETIAGAGIFKTYEEPSYGESLLYTVVQAKQEDLKSVYSNLFLGLISIVKKVDPDKEYFQTEAEIISFVERLTTDAESLTDEETRLFSQTAIAKEFSNIRQSSDVLACTANMRELENHLLIFFCNLRQMDGVEWSMQKIFSMKPSILENVKIFMYDQLSASLEDAGESSSGEVQGK